MDCIVWNVPRTSFWPAKGFQSAKSRSKIFPCLQSKPSECSDRCKSLLLDPSGAAYKNQHTILCGGPLFLRNSGSRTGISDPPFMHIDSTDSEAGTQRDRQLTAGQLSRRTDSQRSKPVDRRQTQRQRAKQPAKQTDRQTEKQKDRQIGRKSPRQRETRTDTDTQRYMKTDRQASRQTDRQSDFTCTEIDQVKKTDHSKNKPRNRYQNQH